MSGASGAWQSKVKRRGLPPLVARKDEPALSLRASRVGRVMRGNPVFTKNNGMAIQSRILKQFYNLSEISSHSGLSFSIR